MLGIYQKDEIEQLRQMATHLQADFIEDDHSARLDFDNEHGRGYISTYQMFPGLVAKTYNVSLRKELKFHNKESGLAPTYFIYCVRGHCFHRFSGSESLEKIHRNQNVILSGKRDRGHEIVLPAEIQLEISIIFIQPEKLESLKNKKARKIYNAVNTVSKEYSLNGDEKFFGKNDPNTAQFAKVLIDNRRVDSLGIIITEGAILNTLASQLSNHENYLNLTHPRSVSPDELKQIIDLGDYIKSNLYKPIKVSDLSSQSGLYPRKLQEGFQFLYGESVAQLIQRLRMERARQLLQSTKLTISEISYRIGITSRSYFSKLFYEYFEALPSEFRLEVDKSGLIFELNYRSTAKSDLKTSDLENIVEEANSFNSQHGITGALIFYKDMFFQLIEGNKLDILNLYERIKQDERNYDVKLIYTGQKNKRTFGKWPMAYLGDKKTASGKNMDGDLSYVNLQSIMEGMEDYEVFSDLLWRRVIHILKKAHSKSMQMD